MTKTKSVKKSIKVKKTKPATKLVLEGEIYIEDTKVDGTTVKHDIDGKLVLKLVLRAI